MFFSCFHCDGALRLPVTFSCGHSVCSSHSLQACPNNCPDQLPVLANHDVTLAKLIALVDDDDDLVAHLRAETARQRHTRPAVPLIQPNPLDDELNCEICAQLFYEPVTTQCQHTFCKPCIQRSLDHSATCPLCRAPLSPIAPVNPNVLLLALLKSRFASQYAARAAALVPPSRLDTPIFICQLSFPGFPTFLHFFEPRYKLMLRRALDHSPLHPHFGMIMRDMEYGTMLDIRSVQMLEDGRSLVETFGTYRFRILERGILDGYTVARIERIDDIPIDVHPDQPNSVLIAHCLKFLNHLHSHSVPWVVQRLSTSYGPPPSYATALENPPPSPSTLP